MSMVIMVAIEQALLVDISLILIYGIIGKGASNCRFDT